MAHTKRCRAPSPSIKPGRKRNKTDHLPDKTTSQQITQIPQSEPRHQLTTEALKRLNRSNSETYSAITNIKRKLQYAPDYVMTCSPEELDLIKEIASRGGFDLSELRALHDGSYRFDFIQHWAGDEEHRSDYSMDEVTDSDIESYDDDSDGDDDEEEEEEEEEEKEEEIQIIEWAGKCANKCKDEHATGITGTGRRLSAKPPSPSPSLGDPRPAVYFPEPPHLDMNDRAQVGIALREAECIMKTLLDRQEELENEI